MHKRIIATDCGSTTTKAILIEKREDGYRLIARGEAPTTVEKPFEDVTIGVMNAVNELEELTNNEFISNGKLKNIDAYVSTSSAGGGLQMLVMGVVKDMTAESAARAALGAGAIVMEVIAINDGRLPYQRIELIRKLRPDMILLAGGTEGGTVKHVVELAQLIVAAEPRPRFGISYKMPLIYAGNSKAVPEIKKILEDKVELYVVENIRPQLEVENLGPAREKIHDLFLEHVMQQAPGYNKLMSLVDAPIMPTPGAVGMLIEKVARENNIEVLGVDIGGATTDVFSVFKGKFNRTVSANLGMSYSIANVMVETGIENILRWIPFNIDEYELRNRIRNKMIRPTTIPMTLEDLIVEQAIAREALRLALEQHKLFASELKGIQVRGDITRAIQQQIERTLVNMMTLNLIIGSGGVLSHTPRRAQSFLMMLDAFQPEGITKMAVDSIFMMPHLGVLSTINEQAAFEVFDRDCLIRLGTSISPKGIEKEGKVILKAEIHFDNKVETMELKFGEIKLFPLPLGKKAKVVLVPYSNFDVGEGPNKKVVAEVEGGVVGLVFDGRGRPLKVLREKLLDWFLSMNAYDERKLKEIMK
ncbi:MAG: glutamate mutase L [candidate division WOR-3 bacterium]|nr:glutamate mutase L [candidate division WOR-3 bacterium]MCX7947415.1 glutamate mutase L [candidate division WOR-3 bacterium]MDW8151187.1 glutamate mutase L [candidate division WOR-3 bacterium]